MGHSLYRRAYKRFFGKPTGKTIAALEAACPLPGGRLMWADGIKLEPDYCSPLEDPTWVYATAASHMRPEDPVLGVADESGAWAFPWWIMKNHHVANVDLAGNARTIIFCEACVTGGLYDPIIDGVRYRWAVTGIADGVTFMRDDQSGTLWNSLTMEPIHGPGMDLPRPGRLPLVQCRWSEWLEAHPDTLVVLEDEEARAGHGSIHPSPDHRERRFEKFKTVPDDDRLDQVAVVLGVDTGTAQAAYPLETLAEAGGIVNDRIGDLDVVLVHRPGTWMATAFRRSHNGHKLDLHWDGAQLTDAHGSGRWTELGVPTGGYHGQPLDFVRGGLEKWHAWSGIFPDAPLYGHE